MAGIIYLSAAEYIKKREFELSVPEFYHPHLPEDFRNPPAFKRQRPNPYQMTAVKRRHPSSFRHIVDPNQMQKASYSIEVMLDMFQKKIEFEVSNDEDFVEILDNIDRYLLTLQPEVQMGVEAVVAYARLMVSWRKEVYKHYYRYMKTHPAALEKLYPNNNTTQNLLHLFSIAGGIREGKGELDPLRAKAFPPYDIEEHQPKDKTAVDDEMGIESSLGLSMSNMLTDDGKGFNFEDFVGKS